MSLRSLPGGVPEPDELIGRDHLIDSLWNQLAANNILLVAPRRFGKTGVMRHVLERPRSGFAPIYIEAEEIPTPDAFAAALISALLEKDILRKTVVGVKKLPEKISNLVTERIDELVMEEFKVKLKTALGDSWDVITRKLIVEMEKAKVKIVFIIDEFPQLVSNIYNSQGEEAAKSFLA